MFGPQHESAINCFERIFIMSKCLMKTKRSTEAKSSKGRTMQTTINIHDDGKKSTHSVNIVHTFCVFDSRQCECMIESLISPWRLFNVVQFFKHVFEFYSIQQLICRPKKILIIMEFLGSFSLLSHTERDTTLFWGNIFFR